MTDTETLAAAIRAAVQEALEENDMKTHAALVDVLRQVEGRLQ